MTAIAYALYAIGLVLVTGVIVMYVKRNPKLSAELQAEFDKLHKASEHLMDHLHLIHQVASAPTAVAFVPLAAPAATTAPPVAAAAPAAPPAQPTTPPAQPGSVTFDPGQYPDAIARKAAAQALLQRLVALYGNYSTRIVGPHGYDIDPQGNEIMPDTTPAVDTSAAELAFSVVGGGVPIPLTGPKTITGCPERVLVRIFAVSGDSSTHVDYNATINGVTIHATGLAILDTNQRGITVNGPTVTVSVDSPGIEFAIQAN